MKLLKVNGKYAVGERTHVMVSDEDYDYLSQFKWCLHKNDIHYYALRGIYDKNKKKKGPTVFLHRVVMNAQKGQIVDHKDRNTLNCTRENLRFVTASQNSTNKGSQRGSASQYLGVSKASDTVYYRKNGEKAISVSKRFIATLKYNKKQIYLGCYGTEEEAARAYDKKAKELYNEYANLNFKE